MEPRARQKSHNPAQTPPPTCLLRTVTVLLARRELSPRRLWKKDFCSEETDNKDVSPRFGSPKTGRRRTNRRKEQKKKRERLENNSSSSVLCTSVSDLNLSRDKDVSCTTNCASAQ